MSLVLFMTGAWGCCFAMDLPRLATEKELTRSLKFPEGEIVMKGKSYWVENGTIFRLIQGIRFRPRCRDPEMEQILPRIVLCGLFSKNSTRVNERMLPVLARLGHALKWGALQDYEIHISAPSNETVLKDVDISFMHLRTEWIRDYLVQKWDIASWRISVAGELEQEESELLDGPNKKVDNEGCVLIVAVGTKGQSFLQACEQDPRERH